VDALLGELDRRFTANDVLMHAVAACDPQSRTFLSAESMMIIADSYPQLKVATCQCFNICNFVSFYA